MSDLHAYLETFDTEPGYLDWASFGPLSPAVREEAHADAELLGTGRAGGIELVSSRAGEARRLLADLLGAPEDEVTLQPSTSYGLQQAIYGLSGDLLLSALEYPALTVAAARAQAARGALRVRDLETESGVVTPDAVAAALDDDVTAVAVSLVDFRTGALVDIAALRDVIGDRLLIVDAVQGFGVVDADWDAADVVCGNGYKWLRAGRGTGFAWFSARARERLEPALSGVTGMDGDLATVGVPAPRADAAAFTVSPADPLAAARLATSLREIADVGVDVIARELRERAGDVITLADRYGFPVRTPRDAHAGIVTLAPPGDEAGRLAAALANHGVTATARLGMIRLAPHVGTGADTFGILGDSLAEIAAARPAGDVVVDGN